MATKKDYSNWLTIALPLIVMVIVAMIGFSVTGLRDRITDNEDDIQRCMKIRDYQTDQQAMNNRINVMEGRLYDLQR